MPIFFAYLGITDSILAADINKYITFDVVLQRWKSQADSSGILQTSLHETPIKTIPCSQLSPTQSAVYDYIGPESYLNNSIKVYGICLDINNEFEINGRASDEEFSLISYRMKPCSLSNKADCAGIKDLMLVNFYWILPETSFN